MEHIKTILQRIELEPLDDRIAKLEKELKILKNEQLLARKEESGQRLLEDVYKYLIENEMDVFVLPSVSFWQTKREYGLVKRMSKREGGYKKFKTDYYTYLRSMYEIRLKEGRNIN